MIDKLSSRWVDHVLENQDCPNCHHKIKDIGTTVKQEIIFKPVVLKRLDHY